MNMRSQRSIVSALGRTLCILALTLATGLAPAAERSDWTIRPVPEAPATQSVRVVPDRADWTYEIGDTVNFRVTVALEPYPEEGVAVKYSIGPEKFQGPEQTAHVPAGGLTLAGGTMKAPGFLRCTVTAVINGKAQRARATAGFSPEAIRPTQNDAADFEPFWAAQKAALAQVPMDPRLTPAPELSTDKVEVSYLRLANVGTTSGPSRVIGVLAVPRGPGPFPAVLQVPGAGVRPYRGNVELAEQGVITLQIGIHGIPVNLPAGFYDDLARGALADYNRANLDDPLRYYYRRVYLGCLRANDYLTAHPRWDGKNLVVMGGSQGGQLSLVTASLDPRVTGLAASFPAYCDVTGYLHGRAGGWPGLFRPGFGEKPVSLHDDDARLTSMRLYDAVNFARRIKVPGFYWWGYNDEICPPTSTFSAYNIILAPKQLVIAPQQGHANVPEQEAAIRAWVLAHVRTR